MIFQPKNEIIDRNNDESNDRLGIGDRNAKLTHRRAA